MEVPAVPRAARYAGKRQQALGMYGMLSPVRHSTCLIFLDGAHNADDDTTYFVLPPSDDAELPWPTPLYGVACYRQIDSAVCSLATRRQVLGPGANTAARARGASVLAVAGREDAGHPAQSRTKGCRRPVAIGMLDFLDVAILSSMLMPQA